MTKMRRADAKEAFSQQQAFFRRSTRHKAHVGDDTGSAAGRAAELAKVREMQKAHRAEQAELHKPLIGVAADALVSTAGLAKAVVTAPFKVAAALRRRRAPSEG